MSIKNEYKKQMDAFCEATCSVTAEDILRKAQATRESHPSGEDNVIKFSEKTKKRTVHRIVILAACLVLMMTTVLAATGKFGDMFRSIFGDDTTADIVDKGYLYEVHQTQTQDIFTVELVAITGDAETPVLVFDVYINDEKLAAENDRIRMLAYTLGVEQYEHELDKYGPNEAYGEKDEEIDNLYHFSMVGAPAWMTRGEEFVVSICQINLDINDDIWTTYEPKIEYRLTVPQELFHPVTYESYDYVSFKYEGNEYHLNVAEFGPYRTQISFWFDLEGEDFEAAEADPLAEELRQDTKWAEFAKTLTLVVDGVEYKVDSEERGHVWLDDEAETGTKNRCYVHPVFASIDFDGASEILLKSEDQCLTIKHKK